MLALLFQTGDGNLWLPEQASTLAESVDSAFNFVNITSGIIFAIVVAGILWLTYRFARRSPGERPAPIHESKLLEAAWIVIPTLLVLVTFFWGFRVYVEANVAPPDSYEINVEGRQWIWNFTYPNGAVTTNEFHVPMGRPVRLVMNSGDVLHSFFIPQFRVKQDVLPNRYSSLWFQATKTGTFDVFCTEYCGTSHSGMIGKVIVDTPEDYETWLQGQSSGEDLPPVELGERLFSQQACIGCHSTDGSAKVGPTMQGLFGKTEQTSAGAVVADENYLRESILQPNAKIVAGFQPVMPASYANLSEAQLTGLIEYIKTLK